MQVKAPYLYQDYRKGSKLVKIDWCMVGGGFLLECIGIAVSKREEKQSEMRLSFAIRQLARTEVAFAIATFRDTYQRFGICVLTKSVCDFISNKLTI
jgi:hypothetical protein